MNISFTEVTNSTGVTYTGPGFGGAWGDFNGDAFPDLFVTNHFQSPPTHYQNGGNGTFIDVTGNSFPASITGDTHGSSWADIDNDSDLDLIVTRGGGFGQGGQANGMYINNGGIFTDQAQTLGISYPLGRGRTPVWLDYNRDGKLDLFVSTLARTEAPPTLFEQTSSGTFTNVGESVGINLESSSFAVLADLTGDGILELISQGSSASGFEPITIYDTASSTFQNISSAILPGQFTFVQDIVAADFNNDLKVDLYLTRKVGGNSDLNLAASNIAEAQLQFSKSAKGLQFESTGTITVNFDSPNFNVGEIFIGSNAINPSSATFTLSPNDPSVVGVPPYNSGTSKGVFIGYNPATNVWQIVTSAPSFTASRLVIESETSISQLQGIGFDDDALPEEDILLLNTGQNLVDATQGSGINVATDGRSVVAGDFDNDMDVDLFIVASEGANNLPDIFYENQGNGTFIEVPNAGGAAGTLQGVGDTVITADYDLDGFLDLLVLNGADPEPFNEDGPTQLFRNQGNQNNWVEIVLEGTLSNRDGIGAQVFVTAGGVTQLREQAGGVHKFAQNSTVLHFGLGNNIAIDEVLIKWPSGIEQILSNLPANQLLKISETEQNFNTVNLSVTPNQASETENTTITVTATATSAVAGSQTLDLALSGAGIDSGDFEGILPTQITIADGQTEGSVTLTVADDSDIEGTETATFAISNPSAGLTLGSVTSGATVITDNDQPQATSTLTIPVDAVSDDFEQFGGSFSSDLEFGLNGNKLQRVGLRFDDITIPAGAAITNAYIAFTAIESNAAPASFTIGIQGSENAPTFSSSGDLTGRDAVAQVNWTNVEAWTDGQTYQSPNIAGLIQQVIGADGTTNGALAFFVEGSGSRAAESFGGSRTPPALVIEFGSTGPSVPAVNLSVTPNQASETENTTITVTATATSAVAGSQTLDLALSGAGIDSGDFEGILPTQITIADGQTEGSVTLTVADDSDIEGTETATFAISNPSSGMALGSVTSDAVAILDNDSGTTQPTETITLEAESADTIVNYRFEQIGVASGGTVLSFVGGTSQESGSASFTFGDTPDELTGTYDITIGTFNESDGAASFGIQMTDFETGVTTNLGSLVLDAPSASNLANAQTKVNLPIAFGVGLTSGDIITVNGFENAAEHARFDFLSLDPVIV